jgi:hypothetical protein
MPFIKFSVTATSLAVLLLGGLVANAVLAPIPTKISAWTTVVTPSCSRCLDVPVFAEAEPLPAAR